MAQTYFKTPFANAGDVVTIPEATQPGGEVSYDQGFGVDYELSSSDVDVLYPERPVINELFKAITTNLQILAQHGFPDWITSADNDGSPYPYDIYSFVRHNDVVYFSLENGNTDEPPSANWSAFSAPQSFKTGMMIMIEASTLPDATWVWANGTTVGNAASNATGRANADTQALFTQIWTTFPNAVRPILDSTGSPSTRGLSAALDFAANKALPVRDMRDVVPAGLGTMGGTTDRGLLTSSNTLGVDGTIFGAFGGEQQHTQLTAELASHSHSNSLSVDGHQLTVAEIPQHQHYVTELYQSGFGPGSVTIDNASPVSFWGQDSSGSGTEYILKHRTTGGGTSVANAGLSSVPIGTALGSAHSHGLSGSISSTGSSAPFNVVQPTTICNYIIHL